MADDAEQAARPAGDEPRVAAVLAVLRECFDVTIGGERWYQRIAAQCVEAADTAAHVGQRDGGAAAGDDTAADPRPGHLRDAAEELREGTMPDLIGTARDWRGQVADWMERRAAASPRDGADTADHARLTEALNALDVPERDDENRHEFHQGERWMLGKVRNTLRRIRESGMSPGADTWYRVADGWRRDFHAGGAMFVQDGTLPGWGPDGPGDPLADSVPRAPVEALLAAIGGLLGPPEAQAAVDEVRRHLDGEK